MKSTAVIAVLLLLLSVAGRAGEIFGSIKSDGKSIGKGVKIELQAGQKTYKAETDSYGSYRCFVQEKGKCTLRVLYDGQTLPIEVYSYAGSTRYDLIVDKSAKKFQLRRK